MMKRPAKYIFILLLLANWFTLEAQENSDPNLKCWFTFNNYTKGSETITDLSGNNIEATLKNGAAITTNMGVDGVLDLGNTNGFLDLGALFGSKVLSELNDFTISVFVFITPEAVISGNGNFVFSFGNSEKMATDGNGCMFFSAKNSRYAISLTHWAGEQGVETGLPMEKGKWKHLAISYQSAIKTARIFIDGKMIASASNISIAPKSLGTPAYNFIGKSSYALNGDAYLAKTFIDEFRLYNVALAEDQIIQLGATVGDLNTSWFQSQINTFLASLEIKDGQSISTNLVLPLSADGISVSWSSSAPETISNTGVVVRPVFGSQPTGVTLTATAVKAGITVVKEFHLTVIPYASDEISVNLDAENLVLKGNLDNLRSDLTLPLTGNEGSVISWTSGNPGIMTHDGKLLYLPENGTGTTDVTLTATISKGNSSLTREFNIKVAEKEGMDAYLFVYFTGNSQSEEAIRFALSDNGFNYKALNNNQPILDSKKISSTGGVRDPHILRGADGKTFYMVATDMLSSLGWNSNRAMVLMKSTNLTDWQTAVVNIQNSFPGYADLLRVWAPQTIFDVEKGKYMIYWSMKIGNEPDKIYFAYANPTFSALETAPQLLFALPDGTSCIDADIVYQGGQYHLFFKTEGSGNGIKKAVSDRLTSGYVIYDKYLQSTTNPVEGGCVFRIYDTDTWLLIYDMYMNGAYQFTQSNDLTHFSVVTRPVSFDFTPRHGTVIPVTKAEADTLIQTWGGTTTGEIQPVKKAGEKRNVISTAYYRIDGKQVKKNETFNKGLLLVITTYDNGTVSAEKIFTR